MASKLWDELWEANGTSVVYTYDINGKAYGPEAEVSHKITNELYGEMGIGNAACAKLDLTLYADTIPRAATIKAYVRLVNGERESEKIPKGIFFANRRSEEDGLWTIEAYDVMRKAEKVWEPRRELHFPMTMPSAAKEFAALMGCAIDERTTLYSAYTIDYPANDATIRQELQFIAAAHGGNWIVTGEGKLLLVPLFGSMPPETHYLITEKGRAIALGGVRILV